MAARPMQPTLLNFYSFGCESHQKSRRIHNDTEHIEIQLSPNLNRNIGILFHCRYMSDRIDKSTSVQATLTRGFLGRLRGMLQDGIINEESSGKDAGKGGARRWMWQQSLEWEQWKSSKVHWYTGTLVVVRKGHLYEGTDLSWFILV